MADRDAPLPRIEGFDVMGLLGRGATSSVYLATQQRFGRPVALKVLDTPGLPTEAKELLRDEARFMAVLSAHPNIVTLFDAGLTGEGLTYLVMEFIPDGSYGQLLRSEGPLAWNDVTRVGIELAGALETSHIHGVVHGDVKPDNVLIGRVGQALLGDFGVAVLLSRSQVAEQALLTPLHAAPELFAGAPASVSTDVYGLGSTLQSLLTGHSPVGGPGDPPATIVSRVERGERFPIASSDAPPELVRLVGALTSEDAAARPASAAEVGRALAEIERSRGERPREMLVMDQLTPLGEGPGPGDQQADGPESTAPPVDEAPVATGPSASRRLRVMLGAGAVFLTVLVAALFLWALSRSSTETASDADVGVTVEGASSTERGGDGRSAGTGAATTAASTTPNLPQSDLAGIQPGIVYGAGDLPNTSASLAATLSEESVIFHDLPAPVTPFSYYGTALVSLPATFHYQSFNEGSRATCAGMMSRPLTVLGLWERATTWSGGFLIAAVAETRDTATSHELATVISLGLGVDDADCHGFGAYNVSDYDDYGVDHRDVDGLVSGGAPYNLWNREGVVVGDRTWPHTTRLVMEVEAYVVDIALATDAPLAAGNDQVVGQIASQIRNRLLAAG